MRALDRKLLRDLWHMREPGRHRRAGRRQRILRLRRIVRHLLLAGRARGRRSTSRRASRDVFADVKRAPQALERRIVEIPGVGDAETTVAFDVTLDLPDVAEPVIGRMIGLPEDGASRLDRLVIRRGRAPEPGRSHEVVVSEGFSATRRPRARPGRGRADQRQAADALHRRRRAVARLHLRDARRRLSGRPQLRRAVDRARAARQRLRHGGRVQPPDAAPCAGRVRARGDRRPRPAARALRRDERVRPRRAALAPHPGAGDQPVAGDRHDDPDHLPRRGRVPAQRGAEPPGGDPARADRGAEGAGLRQRGARRALPAAGRR